MNQLIPINPRTINNQTIQTVSARDLHAFLEVGKDFSTWIKDRIEQFGFSEGADFVKFPEIGESTSKMKMEYALTIDMAKELSMVERNQKGKEARLYFIECEKLAKQSTLIDPKVQLANAVLIAQQVIQEQTLLIETQAQKIEEDQPKVDLYNHTMEDSSLYRRADVAKLLKMKLKDLTAFLKMTEMVYQNSTEESIIPMHDMIMGKYLDVKFPKYKDQDGELKTGKSVLYFTTRGIDVFVRRFKKVCDKYRDNMMVDYAEYVERFAPIR